MKNLKKELLILFVKNPIYGKVKTRLAQTLGKGKALRIYQKLLNHTFKQINDLHTDIIVYVSEPINDSSFRESIPYSIYIQSKGNLGRKIYCAFSEAFKKNYQSVGIIGADCPEISLYLLNRAFYALRENQIVIGPAIDGGYYFLGMRKFYKSILKKKAWSSNKLLRQTLQNCHDLNINYSLLEELRDIDTEEDLFHFPHLLS